MYMRKKIVEWTPNYCVKVKWGNRYISPKMYKGEFYDLHEIRYIVKEIEDEYPQYKGKIEVFRLGLSYESVDGAY